MVEAMKQGTAYEMDPPAASQRDVPAEGRERYPPVCLRARDERAVAGPAAALLCTRSREARPRDEASTAENSGR